ncbi:MAG: hypothetical protein ACXWRE_00055 [Pseudobdellovibrionaceae bacterium]
MKSLNLIMFVSLFIGTGAFAGINSQFSLELKVEPSLEVNVSQLIKERLTPDHGFSREQLETVVHDLAVLASIRGGPSSPLYDKIFSHQKDFNGAWLLQWIMDGTKHLKMSQGNSCGSHSNACGNASSRTIFISSEHFQNDRLHRILTLIHERRHLDGYDHIPGTPSYDKEMEGTRGAQLAFLVSLINSCSNCTIFEKKKALDIKEEIVGTIKNLSEDDHSLLEKELASLQNPMPSDLNKFMAELKTQKSFISINHFECKNEVPLYLYQQQQKALPNVDAQDCFLTYYTKGASPNLGEKFPQPLHRFGVIFNFIPVGK